MGVRSIRSLQEGTYRVDVTNPDGQVVALPAAIEVSAPPE